MFTDISHVTTGVKSGTPPLNFNPRMDCLSAHRVIMHSTFEEMYVPATKYDYHIFAAFDLFILKRKGAESDYPKNVIGKAESAYADMSAEEKQGLSDTILLGLPGSFETYTLNDFQSYSKYVKSY